MIRICIALIWCLILFTGTAGGADISTEISRIEKLPRTKRLAEYETLADLRSLTEADRTRVIQAFAKHAAKLSPAFGESSHKIDLQRWQLMLEFAHKREPKDRAVLFALCQLLIDQGKFTEARPYAEAFRKAYPQDHFARAWSACCQNGGLQSGSLQTIPLHFCVLTRNPQAHQVATKKQCETEVEILNRTFRTQEGKPLVKFVFKGYHSYDDVRRASDELLSWGDSTEPYQNAALTKAFNNCKAPPLRDRNAINVYIYDSHSQKAGFGDKTSHGIRNSNRPFVLIDWERLGGKYQNAEPHEMGHAFGLGHVGVPGAKIKSSTNLMTSAGEKFGSGGQRDLGFSPSQAAAIQYHTGRTSNRLGLR